MHCKGAGEKKVLAVAKNRGGNFDTWQVVNPQETELPKQHKLQPLQKLCMPDWSWCKQESIHFSQQIQSLVYLFIYLFFVDCFISLNKFPSISNLQSLWGRDELFAFSLERNDQFYWMCFLHLVRWSFFSF